MAPLTGRRRHPVYATFRVGAVAAAIVFITATVALASLARLLS